MRTELEELEKREEEIATAIEEASTEEEQTVVEDAVSEYEQEVADKKEKKEALEKELEDIDAELEELDANQPNEDDEEEQRSKTPQSQERGVRQNIMNEKIRTGRFFRGMDRTYVDNLLVREDVKGFLHNVRNFGKQQRAATNAELGIPEVLLPLLRERIEGYSKLMKHVNHISLRGEGRIPIAGTVSEAVWTEACAKLNELAIGFNRVDLDGYKVAGYIDVCTAILEDTDFSLADYILQGFGESVGLAVDKAILYGTDIKMPMGIVTRLAQAAKPADYSAVAPEWVDLTTTNIKKATANATGTDLYSEIMGFAAAAKGKFSASGSKFWAMNESTLLKLKQALLAFNANGALAADISNVLPLIGGTIELLEFMPDGDVIGGYGQLYLLGERHGIKLASSDIPRWYEDETSFKVTARYDGMPVIADAFVAFNVNGAAVTTTTTFPQDAANTVTP